MFVSTTCTLFLLFHSEGLSLLFTTDLWIILWEEEEESGEGKQDNHLPPPTLLLLLWPFLHSVWYRRSLLLFNVEKREELDKLDTVEEVEGQ